MAPRALTESASSRSSIGSAHYSNKKSLLNVNVSANIMRGKRENDNIEININHLHHIRTIQLQYPSTNRWHHG
jgi:hypothetical protein